jgi:hypothetical protein
MGTPLHDCNAPSPTVKEGTCVWKFDQGQQSNTQSGWVLCACNCKPGQKCPEPPYQQGFDGTYATTDCITPGP